MMKTALATKYMHGRVLQGVISSAFEFNREIDRLLWVRKTFGASSEDMESAFAAGAAVGFKTRFLAIRVISDSEFYAPQVHGTAGKFCAAFGTVFINRIPRYAACHRSTISTLRQKGQGFDSGWGFGK